ncbi:YggS family pyridoxal phosphate-dependent enzyme [Desertibaculum subflavum]|uniref:YggS family pyridoxal phosphate-dependent enzyme n=1 Tax=Desertibaculum subflavum TaxID=2268458 RepID=UPI000E6639A3
MSSALPPSRPDIAANLAFVKAKLVKAAADPAHPPRLIAVSKTMPPEAVREALAAGHRLFGENRVQEAMAKFPPLRAEFPDLELHLIGPLQTNKVREAVATFDAIQTVDREKLARALAAEMQKQGRRPDCYVQVNTGEEPQKAGALPLEADALVRLARDELGLPVIGLMCIPPAEEEPAPHFALLAKIAARNGLNRLSMGMSSDFEVAAQLGATEVRVGSAIFGARPSA